MAILLFTFFQGLLNKGMRERHWLQLSTDTGQDIDPDKDPDFTLQTAFDMELFKVRWAVGGAGCCGRISVILVCFVGTILFVYFFGGDFVVHFRFFLTVLFIANPL